MYPQCSVEFVKGAEGGVAFRLKDRQGRYRSEVIRLNRYTDGILTRTSLDARVRLTTASTRTRARSARAGNAGR